MFVIVVFELGSFVGLWWAVWSGGEAVLGPSGGESVAYGRRGEGASNGVLMRQNS